VRYDQFGDMGHPIDRMAHQFNMTVPGVLGYRPQKAGLTEDFERIGDPTGGSNPYLSLGAGPNYTTDSTGLLR
jgi:hypothetical protein